MLRNRFSRINLAVAVAVLVAACSDGSGGPTEPDPGDPTGPGGPALSAAVGFWDVVSWQGATLPDTALAEDQCPDEAAALGVTFGHREYAIDSGYYELRSDSTYSVDAEASTRCIFFDNLDDGTIVFSGASAWEDYDQPFGLPGTYRFANGELELYWPESIPGQDKPELVGTIEGDVMKIWPEQLDDSFVEIAGDSAKIVFERR